VTDCQLLQYEWVIMPRCRIEGSEIQAKWLLKKLEKLGCKKYAMAKITQVNMVPSLNPVLEFRSSQNM
jgi:hypothetical protein